MLQKQCTPESPCPLELIMAPLKQIHELLLPIKHSVLKILSYFHAYEVHLEHPQALLSISGVIIWNIGVILTQRHAALCRLNSHAFREAARPLLPLIGALLAPSSTLIPLPQKIIFRGSKWRATWAKGKKKSWHINLERRLLQFVGNSFELIFEYIVNNRSGFFPALWDI